MILAIALFVAVYILMLAIPKYRPYIALGGAAVFVILGICNVYDYSPLDALSSIDFNVLMMITGTMGVVALFIESKMPALLSELLIKKVPNVMWAVTVLSLFAGVISAFVDNVATVLMVAPVGLAISKKLGVSPVPVLISIAVSSNLQGAATLVGDTTSMLLAGEAGMNFLDFFFMKGRFGIFWGVELGALVSILILLFLFRKEKQPIDATVETKVTEYFPSVLMIGIVVLLIISSFLPPFAESGVLRAIYDVRSGLICMAVCVVGLIRKLVSEKSFKSLAGVLKEIDLDTILMLTGIFVIVGAIDSAGVIKAIADLFVMIAGNNTFFIYTLIVVFSVVLSAFIDNIPYVMTMLPVAAELAGNVGMGDNPYLFYFGLLIGSTLGGNLTPIGASANIAAIGILKKNGETVTLKDFLRIGVPFTLAAVLSGYLCIWFVWN